MRKIKEEVDFLEWLVVPLIAITCTSPKRWVRATGVIVTWVFTWPWMIAVGSLMLIAYVVIMPVILVLEAIGDWWERI